MANLLKGVRVIESAMRMTGDFTGPLLADEGAQFAAWKEEGIV